MPGELSSATFSAPNIFTSSAPVVAGPKGPVHDSLRSGGAGAAASACGAAPSDAARPAGWQAARARTDAAKTSFVADCMFVSQDFPKLGREGAGVIPA